MKIHPGLFTNNLWKAGTGTRFTSLNPANGEILWDGNASAPEDVALAVQNAEKAFDAWSNLSVDERIAFLHSFAEILKQESSLLAETISKETGKPLWDSRAEVKAMSDKVEISVRARADRCPDIIREHAPPIRTITRHRPHGVIAVLGPFNFPGHLTNGQIVPALLAGNTVVLKPSELTPLVSEIMVGCWEKAGLPPGVLNLVQGGPETGKALAENPILKGLFFVGSYPTGKRLAETFGVHPDKILVLEMGGNNPLLIGDTENLALASYVTVQSAYLTSGQRCTCARRLIVPFGKKGDEFIRTLISMIEKIVVGAYDSQPEPYMGPVIRESHAQKILDAQQQLAETGGETLIEVRHLKPGTGFLRPGLMDVTNVKNRPDIEIFGPFLQLIRVATLEEAVREANRTVFGLTAGIITRNDKEFDYFYKNIRAGIVNRNSPLTGASGSSPFGGVGCSGNFRASGYYAADYCSYPVASLQTSELIAPVHKLPGISL